MLGGLPFAAITKKENKRDTHNSCNDGCNTILLFFFLSHIVANNTPKNKQNERTDLFVRWSIE